MKTLKRISEGLFRRALAREFMGSRLLAMELRGCSERQN
jgi:hypothetical protein